MAKGFKTGGKKKGFTEEKTRAIRGMVAAALEGVGGQAYLERQAEENPVAFMGLVGKVIPKEVNANVGGGIQIRLFTGIDEIDAG